MIVSLIILGVIVLILAGWWHAEQKRREAERLQRISNARVLRELVAIRRYRPTHIVDIDGWRER